MIFPFLSTWFETSGNSPACFIEGRCSPFFNMQFATNRKQM